jgi:hypothetical protein
MQHPIFGIGLPEFVATKQKLIFLNQMLMRLKVHRFPEWNVVFGTKADVSKASGWQISSF